MDIYPAIDIRKGRVVRLSQGDQARETVYADDPVAQAERFVAAGAQWVHVVDLDRAFGDGNNLGLVKRIVAALDHRAQVQAGGGFRALEAIGEAVGVGVARVVIGTAAITDPGLVATAVGSYSADRLAVGLDARKGLLAIRGWKESSDLKVRDVAQRVVGDGVATLIYTDIGRDGTLAGPDVEGCTSLLGLGADVIASGGFAKLEHVKMAARVGCAGAILGRSLYEGTMSLGEALRAAREA